MIEGVTALRGTCFRVIPDRIVASTFMAAAAVTNGDVLLRGVVPAHIGPVLPVFEETGCRIDIQGNTVRVRAPVRLNRFKSIRTLPYPGFPTDSQSTTMAMACVAKGTSVIIESIFESRYKQAAELGRMGAQIEVEWSMAVVEGVERLHGANVTALDLRGGTALVVAGLCAQGTTSIGAVHLIDRGCQDLEKKLTGLGADIRRIQGT